MKQISVMVFSVLFAQASDERNADACRSPDDKKDGRERQSRRSTSPLTDAAAVEGKKS